MEFYKEILFNFLATQDFQITFPNLKLEPEKIIEIRSYKALERIREILKDDRYSDDECFHKIEEIVQVFELLGSGAGNRHDFG